MNIYVAKFDAQLDNEQLKDLFSPYGKVTAAVVEMDGFTEQSRCFGYVEMPDETEGDKAIAALNHTEINGSIITVEKKDAKPIRSGSYKVGNTEVNPYRFKRN